MGKQDPLVKFPDWLKSAGIATEKFADEARDIVESDPLLKGKRGDQLINLLKIFKKTDATNLLAAG